MAILIPSKNIYEKQNPIIIDNAIDNVSIGSKSVSTTIETNSPVFNSTLGNTSFGTQTSEIHTSRVTDQGETVLNSTHDTTCAGVYHSGTFDISVACVYFVGVANYANGKITIPKIYGDEYISSIRNGVVDVVDPNAEETKPNQIISYRILGTKKVRPLTARLGRYTYALDDSFKITSNGFIFDMTYGEQTSEAVVLELPPIPKTYFIKTSDSLDLILQAQISTYVEVKNHPTYFFVSSDEENYYLNFKIYSGGTFREMYGVNVAFGLSAIPSEDKNELSLSGQETIFTATEIEITINGTKFVTKVEDKTETYGSGKHPFSLSGSEILQDTNTTEGVSSTRSIANKILTQYRNGKETAVLLCDISDYYEYDPTADKGRGQKVISIATSDRMTFAEGDEVIPMIFGANGKDKPMSLKKDGTPKVFRVVGVRIFYDGAVWQEISLQEI